jgi:hypothetical protein
MSLNIKGQLARGFSWRAVVGSSGEEFVEIGLADGPWCFGAGLPGVENLPVDQPQHGRGHDA